MIRMNLFTKEKLSHRLDIKSIVTRGEGEIN